MSLQDPPHLSWLSLCCRTGAGPVLLRSHVVTVAIWGTLTLFITCYNHHGHQLIKSLPDHPTFHDFHHSHNDGNFGMARFLDWFHGTDRTYRKYLAKQASLKQ
eukprot:m.736260 g.736260  ORF g.736260 m.736260 type:complete len:103 (-) comp58896_c0_seq14:142-450(-)